MSFEELPLQGDTYKIDIEKNEEGVPIKLHFTFFTPDHVADMMLDMVERRTKINRILEPSAGTGKLVRAARRRLGVGKGAFVCVEPDRRLAEPLIEEGYQVFQWDFLDFDFAERFELILMSPPFGEDGGIAHVDRAFEEYLQPGGQLVAIMSKDIISKNGPPWNAFRNKYFQSHIAKNVHLLPRSTFQEGPAFVDAIIVRLEKPENEF